MDFFAGSGTSLHALMLLNNSDEELKSDIHVQMFYKQLRLRKDDWLKNKR